LRRGGSLRDKGKRRWGDKERSVAVMGLKGLKGLKGLMRLRIHLERRRHLNLEHETLKF
jgi:hypothetical protein